jgi:orotate phosphoribosyltransferase/AMMECR1 domain-containing protein
LSVQYIEQEPERPPARDEHHVARDRDELRRFLKEEGVLQSGPEQPIKGRDGRQSTWMFYSWNCSLTGRGAHLAGRLILDKLRLFNSTQLATFGYTGVPLMSAVILQGDDRYTGLVIREARKTYGASRRIDGPADKRRPVVVIDDSLSSGTSLRQAITALEEDGFEVEGTIALVNFPFRGGLEWATALGYRVEFIFEAWKDLSAPGPAFVPGHKRLGGEKWADEHVPDGLNPATAARRVTEHYLRNGTMLRPPRRFDKDADGRGGVFVSFRERHSDHRLAREGFWHFDPEDADACRDLVLATVKTLISSRGAVTAENLPRLKIGASFFSPLEKVKPGKLDFMRYGIVARSAGFETKMGGALPNSQIYTSEIEQYTHARWRNAKIRPAEPHDLFRHEIAKFVEPGEYWLPYGSYHDPGTDWTNRAAIGKALTERARAALKAAATKTALGGEPLADGLIPAPVYAIAVTLYHHGVVGCFLSWSDSLDGCVVRAATRAFSDARFVEKKKGQSIDQLAISVSVLHDREWLGEVALGEAAIKLRMGADTMSVQQGDRRGFLLASVGPHFNWSKERFAKELLRKAGIEKPPYAWCTYQTATWLEMGRSVCKIVSGFPERGLRKQDATQWASNAALLGSYIARNIGENGLPEYAYLPVTGQRTVQGSPARLIHALAALDEASRALNIPAWGAAARRGFTHCLRRVVNVGGKRSLSIAGQTSSAMADCQLLAAAAASDLPETASPSLEALAARVKGMIQPDGRVTDTPKGLGVASEHDFLPGVALLGLARYAAKKRDASLVKKLAPQLDWYRRRFRLLQPWGMVGWHTQAWNAIHKLTGEAEQASFVFEMADWAADWQQERTGAFITDLSPTGPSFHTGFLAEGMAAAWELALRTGDSARAARYAHSCHEALRFMEKLTIYPEDGFCLHDPKRAAGGVRCSLITSHVRIDFVSHTLIAFVRSLALRHASAAA